MAATRDAYDEEGRRSFRVSAIRALLACVAVALVIGLYSGAHDALDVVQWIFDSVVGASVGLVVARRWVPRHWFNEKPWAAALAIAFSVTLPVGVAVIGWLVLLRHKSLTLDLVVGVLPSVFGTALVMTALSFLVRRGSTQTHAAPPNADGSSAPPPKFLARLPEKLRGAEIFAVEAEDHYLRLHTSLGQDLILLRLADAIAELDGLEGAQTHRSWWVARAAIAEVERGDGRATLTLKDGAEVPVSRGFARQLRAAGWF
ncbi:MAG TPA: LytTR family DNA-binding domain-containing protein [Caulobacteraceae bacterium]|nr:LytTR family DNA-binding domain-containing protein [Caulobacteraceae bacterium]